MIPVLELTELMARRADRCDRRRLAQKAWGEREAMRLRKLREVFRA